MKKKIVIATHGTLAVGYKNTLELISGPQPNVFPICFYDNQTNSEEELTEQFESITDEEQLIILTDIQFGSVNQIILKKIVEKNMPNIFLFSGINLPLVLELISMTVPVSSENIRTMTQQAAEQVKFINYDTLLETQDDNEFFS